MKNEPVFLNAPFELRTETPESATLQGVAYTGAALRRWGETIIVDVDSLRAEQQLPILLQHEPENYIGISTSIDNSGGKIAIAGMLFVDVDEKAKQIREKTAAGAKYQLSIGAYDYSVESIPVGKTVGVNGAVFNGPCSVLRDAHLREVSIVTLGADSNTSVSIFNANSEQEMTELELQIQKNAELEAKLLAAQEAAAAAEQASAAIELSARKSNATALLNELGVDVTDELVAQYSQFNSEQFTFLASQLRLINSRIPAELFKHQATSGKREKPSDTLLSVARIYGKRK